MSSKEGLDSSNNDVCIGNTVVYFICVFSLHLTDGKTEVSGSGEKH